MMFKPATKKQSKLRLALTGPSGSGKTYSALSIAAGLGTKVALIDTEHGSASLYADKFKFDALNLETFSPETYVEAIKAAEAGGYDVLVIDSLSHAWMGKDGALEQVDKAGTRSGSKNTYFAWRDVTPKHNALVEAIISCKSHVIATMRAKTEYALDKDDKGKVSPRKIGLAPVQRDGMEYEFTIAGELDLDHHFVISKSRCSELAGKVLNNPGLQVAEVLKKWLEQGAPELVVVPTAATDKLEPIPAEAPMPRERLRATIRAARTLEQLEALVPEIQRLSDLDREAVRPDYGKRKSELAAGKGA